MYIGIGFYLCVIYMAYLKKTKRSKRKMRKTMRIRGGANSDQPVAGAPMTGSNEQTQPEAVTAPDTKQQALAELEQVMAGLNKAVELLKQ